MKQPVIARIAILCDMAVWTREILMDKRFGEPGEYQHYLSEGLSLGAGLVPQMSKCNGRY